MADSVNIMLPASLNDVLDKINESGFFSDKITICKFAFAYAIRHHFNEFDPKEVDDQWPADGINYNIGSVDADKFLYNFVISTYPNCDTPYKYTRGIIIFGLNKLDEKLKGNSKISFDDIL